jgi:hypothetical protein
VYEQVGSVFKKKHKFGIRRLGMSIPLLPDGNFLVSLYLKNEVIRIKS